MADIHIDSLRDVDALLDAIVRPADRAHSMLAGRRTVARAAMAGVIFAAAAGVPLLASRHWAPFATGWFVLIGAASVAAGILQRARVTVQADGLRIHRWGRRGRKVTFDAVVEVVAGERDLVLVLRDGERVHMHASSSDLSEPAALVRRIEERRQ